MWFIQRALFGVQTPLGLLAGIGAFLSIPNGFSSDHKTRGKSVLQKLAQIDYAGAFMLVSIYPLQSSRVDS